LLVQFLAGAFELMHNTIDGLASKEIVGFLTKKTQRGSGSCAEILAVGF